jgi:hypothetical protein
MRKGLDIRWIAGFFDAEGCIGIYPISRGNNFHLRTQVTQAISRGGEEILGLLAERFGGCVPLLHNKGIRRQKAFNWQLNGDKAASFLEAIEPYLLMKQEEAALAIWWQRSRPQPKRRADGTYFAYPLSRWDLDAQVAIRLKDLKKI